MMIIHNHFLKKKRKLIKINKFIKKEDKILEIENKIKERFNENGDKEKLSKKLMNN